jgi:glycosyltransferase involved in cell wall biosynthesis
MSIAIESLAPASAPQHQPPLRVLLVTQVSGGGTGRHFLDLAQGLTARGVEVVGIQSPRQLDQHFREQLAARWTPPMHGLPMRRAVHPLDAADLWRMIRMIRRLGPFDLVHGHSSKGGALARLAASAIGIPSIYTPHAIVTLDPTLPAWRRRCYAWVERRLARRTGAIIAVSEDEARHIRLLGINARTVHVVPNGIDRPCFPGREHVRAQLGLGADDVVIGFVGRLSPQKAPDVLLEACAALFARGTKARLVMVGSGPLEAETRQRAAALGLGSRVMLLGDVVATDVMPAFDVFCLSSRYEGMPYVLLEALAAGLPIVSTRVGGAAMCVEHGRNGLLVALDDAAALSAALATLADDRQLRQSFAAASRQIAAGLTTQQMVDRTLAVYNAVLTRRAIH